jgi:transcriptional regulator PpsR
MQNTPPDEGSGRLADLAPEVASTVVRVAGDIALVIGDDGVIRNVADGNLPLSRADHDWVGKRWADAVSAAARGKVESLLSEARQHGVSRRREFNHPGAEGAEIPVSWAAVRLGRGGPLLAVGRDLRAVSAIQQRFQEAQLSLEREYWQRRQTESHYRLLFQVAHDAVLVLDAETGLVLEANAAADTLFGRAGGGFEGLALQPFVDESLRPVVDELLLTARTTGHAAEVRLRAAHDGAPLDVSATPFHTDDRRGLLLRARRAAAAADDLPAVLEFIGHTPDAVVVTDASGRVLWANPAFVDLCGAPEGGHVRGRLIGDVLGDTRQQWPALLARVRARGVVARDTVVLQAPGWAAGGVKVQAAEVSGALLAEGDQEHIGFTLRPRPAGAAAPADVSLDLSALMLRIGSVALPDLLADAGRLVEAHLIEAALRAAQGRIDLAAQHLRMDTPQLLQRMQALALPLPEPAGPDN